MAKRADYPDLSNGGWADEASLALAYTRPVKVVWDQSKNDTNRKKHGVSLEEASALFTAGHDYLEIFDDAHSDEGEGRNDRHS